MDVRQLARRVPFVVALIFASAASCKHTQEDIEDWDWKRGSSFEVQPPRGPSFAQMWQDGFGFNNPNGPKILNGEKKPGDKPTKESPFYERPWDRDQPWRPGRKPESDFRVEEPKFDLR